MKTLDRIIKYVFYILVFFLPLFFLPWTRAPLAANKQFFLTVFAALLLILWLVKVIIAGKIRFFWNKTALSVLILIVLLGVSCIFSISRRQSFWGMAFEADTFFNLLLAALVFFLVYQTNQPDRADKPDWSYLKVLLASAAVLAVLFLVQTLAGPVFPWDFAKTPGFNPVGTAQGLSLFFGGMLVFLLVVPRSTFKVHRSSFNILRSAFYWVLGILLFVSILLVNYWVTWVLLVLGCLLILWVKLTQEDTSRQKTTFFNKGAVLPIILLVVALLFLFIEIPLSNWVKVGAEVGLTQKATFRIAEKTVLSGFKNFLFGSGPATFVQGYDLFRSSSVNLTDFWSVRFSQGASFFGTNLATSGILGALAILFLIVIFFWEAGKSQRPQKTETTPEQPSQGNLVFFIPTFYFLVSWFLYPANLTLLFVAFLNLGFCAFLFPGKTLELSFGRTAENAASKYRYFSLVLVCLLLIIGLLGGIYKMGGKYAGALNFATALKLINGPASDLDKGIEELVKAANRDKKDVYFRNLSQAVLLKIKAIFEDKTILPPAKPQIVQGLASDVEKFATQAVKLNPANSANWLQLGQVYENLAAVGVGGADDLVVATYKKTKVLAPQNPQIPLNLGRFYNSAAQRLGAQIAALQKEPTKNAESIAKLQEKQKQFLASGLEEAKQAIQLKNNFALAYFLSAQIYELQGEKSLALENYQVVLKLEPGNEWVKSKVGELSR